MNAIKQSDLKGKECAVHSRFGYCRATANLSLFFLSSFFYRCVHVGMLVIAMELFGEFVLLGIHRPTHTHRLKCIIILNSMCVFAMRLYTVFYRHFCRPYVFNLFYFLSCHFSDFSIQFGRLFRSSFAEM